MFGEHGWTNDKVNVITAIGNTTKILMDPHKTYVFFFRCDLSSLPLVVSLRRILRCGS